MVLRGRWKSDGEGGFDSDERHWAREFMYDNPRARFMARELDPADFHPYTADDPNTPGVDEAAWLWTDYVGTTPTLDLELRTIGSDPDELSVVEKRSYGPGGWQDLAYDPNDPNAPPTVSATRYTHGDLIDSTVLTTDESANAVATVAYTAFGEQIGPGSVGVPPANMQTRYRYAGGHGYEGDVLHGSHAPLNGPNPTLAPITLLHVGARWYDPSIGRFVQRDPASISDGPNVYLYTGAEPIQSFDDSGRSRVQIFVRAANGAWRFFVGRGTIETLGCDILVRGEGSRAVAKRLAKKRWRAERIVHHDPHAGYRYPHYQPQPGWGSGYHIFYDALDCIGPIGISPELWGNQSPDLWNELFGSPAERFGFPIAGGTGEIL